MNVKPTKTNVRQIIQELAKEYRVRVFFTKNMKSRGLARYWRRSISLCAIQPPRIMISTFFHELGHVYCYDNGLWASYHNEIPPIKMSYREKQLLYRTALRAERWVDKWAEHEMSKHYPELKYYTTYNDDEVVKDFLKSIKKELCVH